MKPLSPAPTAAETVDSARRQGLRLDGPVGGTWRVLQGRRTLYGGPFPEVAAYVLGREDGTRALAGTLRTVADLQGTPGAATPAELRELAGPLAP